MQFETGTLSAWQKGDVRFKKTICKHFVSYGNHKAHYHKQCGFLYTVTINLKKNYPQDVRPRRTS